MGREYTALPRHFHATGVPRDVFDGNEDAQRGEFGHFAGDCRRRRRSPLCGPRAVSTGYALGQEGRHAAWRSKPEFLVPFFAGDGRSIPISTLHGQAHGRKTNRV